MKFCFSLIVYLLFGAWKISQAQTYVSTSPDSVCAGATNVVYRIPPPANQTSAYTWAVSGAATFVNFNAPVNDSIYVNWPATVGIDIVSVFESAGAGCTGPTAQLEVHRYLPTAALTGNVTICQGNAINSGLTITFTGRKPFSVTFQFVSGANVIGPFTINNIQTNTYNINLPAIPNAGAYSGSIVSASDAGCNIANPSGSATVNVITQPTTPIIQHLD